MLQILMMTRMSKLTEIWVKEFPKKVQCTLYIQCNDIIVNGTYNC